MKNRILVHPKFIVNAKGKKEAVILSYEEYQELIENMEDIKDAVLRKNEPSRLFSEYHRNRMKKYELCR